MKLSRITAFSSSLLLGAVLALTGAGQAQATDTALALDYVALGDSYSSGVGAGSYDSASGDCKRSTKAYPKLWAAAHSPSSFAFTACSGARTGDVTAGQLAPLSSATDLVSITVGGNDAGFSDVMTTCVLQSESSCINRINQARAYVDTTLPGKLDSVYSAIRSKAPAARVVVLGYPRFYKLSGSCIAGLSENEAGRDQLGRPTISTPPSQSARPTTATTSRMSCPPSPDTRSAPGRPGCTASTGSTSASPTTPPPPDSPAAICPSSPRTPEHGVARARCGRARRARVRCGVFGV